MRRTTVGFFAVAALAVTGCGAGQNPGVQKANTTIDGVNVDLNNGQLAVRNAFVTPTASGVDRVPKGGAVKVYAHIFNNSSQADDLVAVECLNGGVTEIISASTRNGFGAVPGASQSIALPSHSLTRIGYPSSAQVVISNLGVARFVGTHITLRLSFADAGSITIDAPIEGAPSGTEETGAA